MPLFQSTPVIANGRISRSDLLSSGNIQFQSTPVIANGRIDPQAAQAAGADGVSIHARYC